MLFSFSTTIYSQEKNTKDIYLEALKYQIDFERKNNQFSSMNVVFIDEKYSNIALSYEGVSLHNLAQKDLKTKSRKGLDIIEIYPIEIIDDQIRIETLSVFRKKKNITIYGKSSYYFKYDCNKREYVLKNKNQKMI